MVIQNTVFRPSPAQFEDYRAFLRAMVAYLKASQRGFSYRNFSRKAGYTSPNFLKLVADGKRNLSTDSVNRFALALDLSAREREDFENLVFLGQAKTDEERNYYYTRLRRRSAARGPTARMETDQYEVYSLWYAIPIRELMLLDDFQEDPDWIARQFRHKLKASEAAKALELLERTGLAARDEKGRLRPASTKLATAGSVQSLAVRNYHRALLSMAAETLDGLPTSERNITSLTLAVTREQYDEICRKIAAFREELLDSIEDAPRSSGEREVVALGFQVFPVTGRVKP